MFPSSGDPILSEAVLANWGLQVHHRGTINRTLATWIAECPDVRPAVWLDGLTSDRDGATIAITTVAELMERMHADRIAVRGLRKRTPLYPVVITSDRGTSVVYVGITREHWPTLADLRRTHPAYRRYLRDVAQGQPIPLADLWRAFPVKPWLSPKRYLRQWGAMHGDIRIEPDGVIRADAPAALHYLQMADEEILHAVGSEVFEAIRADPFPAIIERSDSPYALVASSAAIQPGETVASATGRVVAEVASRTEDHDEYQQETIVARTRRAFDEILRPIPPRQKS